MAFKLFKAQNPKFTRKLLCKTGKIRLAIFKSRVGREATQRRGQYLLSQGPSQNPQDKFSQKYLQSAMEPLPLIKWHPVTSGSLRRKKKSVKLSWSYIFHKCKTLDKFWVSQKLFMTNSNHVFKDSACTSGICIRLPGWTFWKRCSFFQGKHFHLRCVSLLRFVNLCFALNY